ncbi:phage integrase SAM-like domain-containing protein [Vagococcus carniphilus]|uniref:phage integrase SAM-like domain-containing protein n=1 Tax=Vagococcus carniphilus TaxID=218144 RepID=UPI00288D70BD|nr:phage integrase SAM-like domain-containing protein [Vagococcus carniphilus]MDT2832268.1 phage integrase SAM-like domain-containing protein [Vagococcus carniphilus]MDT2841020.1 phage integrase SAM-like domain-containing protein [Vagococcus carniphilus]MDT2855755.1 phage integrase SAM-like domain-containing protein [Vagococcus carniphilus]
MTIRKDNKTGTYTVDVSNGFNAVTNRRNRIIRKGLKTKKEAIQLENHLRITNLDEQPALRGATLDTLYSIMVTEDLKRDAKASYIETQERNYNKHFKKYFEVARIEKLTYKDMETFRQSLLDKKVNNKSDKTLSNNTVNKQMILMHKLMKIACKHGYIKENPCQYLTKLPVEKKPSLIGNHMNLNCLCHSLKKTKKPIN